MLPFQCRTRDAVVLDGSIFPTPKTPRGTLILAHGLPAGRPDPEATKDDPGYPGLARRLAVGGYHVAIFNFRGTGASGGHLQIDLWPLDLAAVIDHLDQTVYRRATYAVAGFSAGGAAAILTAADEPRIDPLITLAAPADYLFLTGAQDVEAWFRFYRELGMIRDGYAESAPAWAARFERVRPAEALPRCRAENIYLVHGTADDVVPFSHLDRLAQAAGERGRVVRLDGAAHQLRKEPRAVDALVEILGRHASLPSGAR